MYFNIEPIEHVGIVYSPHQGLPRLETREKEGWTYNCSGRRDIPRKGTPEVEGSTRIPCNRGTT